jgi:hypothetical protein
LYRVENKFSLKNFIKKLVGAKALYEGYEFQRQAIFTRAKELGELALELCTFAAAKKIQNAPRARSLLLLSRPRARD